MFLHYSSLYIPALPPVLSGFFALLFWKESVLADKYFPSQYSFFTLCAASETEEEYF